MYEPRKPSQWNQKTLIYACTQNLSHGSQIKYKILSPEPYYTNQESAEINNAIKTCINTPINEQGELFHPITNFYYLHFN